MSVWLNVAVVIALVLVEGLFVAAELALVSLREGQARALAERSRRGQKVVKLVTNPNRFLAAVQLGVTLTALLSSAFGAITLSKQASTRLRHAGLGKSLADVLGFLGRHDRHHLRDARRRRARPKTPGVAAHRADQPALRAGAGHHRARLAAGDLAAVGVHQRSGQAARRRPVARARRPSPKRSCAGWSRRTRRSGSRSGRSSTRSSRRAPGWCARCWCRVPR